MSFYTRVISSGWGIRIDAMHWYAYLCLLVWAGFSARAFDTTAWLNFSVVLYLLCASISLRTAFGGRANLVSLYKARVLLLIFCLVLLILFLQTVLPISTFLHDLLLLDEHNAPPPWFSARSTWSVVPAETRWLLLSELMMFAVLVVSIVLIDSRRRTKQLLFILMLMGLVHASAGIVAKYAGFYLVDKAHLDGHFSAARGWFINRNHFGAFVSLSLAGALALQLKSIGEHQHLRFTRMLVSQILSFRMLYLTALLVSLMAIVLSQSRGAFLALLTAALICLPMLGKKVLPASYQRRILAIGSIFTLLLLVYFGQDLLDRFTSDTISIGERSVQWSVTWSAIKEELLLGYGGNSYATVFQTVREYSDVRQLVYDQSHNDYLHIWLEQGLLGLILWLMIIVVTLRQALHACWHTRSLLVRSTSLASIVVIVAALLQSFVDFNLQIINIRYYFFVIMALVFSISSINHRKGALNEKRT